MLTDKEILRLSNEFYNDFLTDFLVDCQIEIVSSNKFYNLVSKEESLKLVLKEKAIDSIKGIDFPIFSYKADKYKITICSTLIWKITKGFSNEKQKMFIKAITLHELYHIVNNADKRGFLFFEFLLSEKGAFKEFKEDNPELYMILDETKKRYKKR